MAQKHKSKKLIIFGLGDFAEIAMEYFQKDSDFEVVGFSVEREFLTDNRKFGRPVHEFESLNSVVDTTNHYFFCALLYTNMNDVRTRVIKTAEEMGFKLATYVSSQAFVWDMQKIGEHCFIFEHNTIQPFVTIERNCILWSGNHIGHHSVIRENTFISSHVVISGAVEIGANCFIGVNSTISNSVTVGKRSWLSMSSIVTKNLPNGSLVLTQPSRVMELNESLLSKKLAEIAALRVSIQ
jgi:sugar O-acyltransferase (sialic acid O-acetyltransferase NeuD family)